MYYHHLPPSDISAIACMARRIETTDPVYGYIYDMLKEELSRERELTECFETSSRRAIFRQLFERHIVNATDRYVAVANALTAARAVTQGVHQPQDAAAREEVHADNYVQKVDELVDLLARYNPSEQEINALARRLNTAGAVFQTTQYAHKRLEKLALQATAMHRLAKHKKLHAFNESTTLTDAVEFVLLNDAVSQLYTLSCAGTAGEVIGALVGIALILAAIIGGITLYVAGVTALIGVHPLLGLGALLGSLALLCFRLEEAEALYNKVSDKILTTSATVVGDVVTKAVNLCIPDPDPEAIYL